MTGGRQKKYQTQKNVNTASNKKQPLCCDVVLNILRCLHLVFVHPLDEGLNVAHIRHY